MNTQLLEQTLVTQNPHWGDISYRHHFVRKHDRGALADLQLAEIQVITGIRRTGKSTLLETLINHLMGENEPKSILYMNFDDPSFTEATNDVSLLPNIIAVAEKLTTHPVNMLIMDEVQNVLGWEKYVKSMYDSKIFSKIIVSGSNADLLKSDYTQLLSGRYIETQLYPLSYSELIHNKGISAYYGLTKQKPTALACTDALLQYGGFPRIHCIDNHTQRIKILKHYYETILLKDCIKNHDIRDTKLLTNLAYYLLSNPASLYSYNSLSKALGSNENTIKHFIQILEDAYFFDEIKTFSYSLKAQTRYKKKAYCIDNGFITSTAFSFSSNHGKLLENAVYSELLKSDKGQIYFYNDKKECDFVLHGTETVAIQVCYQLTPENRERELSGLQAAMEAYTIPRGIIITYDQEEDLNQQHIKIVPFWKYFF